jgi:hypothetical protein
MAGSWVGKEVTVSAIGIYTSDINTHTDGQVFGMFPLTQNLQYVAKTDKYFMTA